MIDPAQKRHDDQRHHDKRRNEQHKTPALAVKLGIQRNQPDQRKQEGAEKGGERPLRRAIFQKKAGGAGRCGIGRSTGCRDKRRQRKRGDGKHAGRDDRQDAVDRIGPEGAWQFVGQVGRNPDGGERRGHAEQAIKRGGEPQPPHHARDKPPLPGKHPISSPS